nr:adenylyl-sulfate kinase [Agrobacterium tumefaciens]
MFLSILCRIAKEQRAALTNQRPVATRLTRLSGAGKSTIGNILEASLHAAGRLTYLIDGETSGLV